MKDSRRFTTSGILQPAIQFKGGMDELDDFLNQIAKFDPTFKKSKYLEDNFDIDINAILKSDTIHLSPFLKKIK